jgi:hypothetical protein
VKAFSALVCTFDITEKLRLPNSYKVKLTGAQQSESQLSHQAD